MIFPQAGLPGTSFADSIAGIPQVQQPQQSIFAQPQQPQGGGILGGLFNRINQAASTPAFNLGLGFLQGNPLAGAQAGQQAQALQQRKLQQIQAQQAAQQQAQAAAAQQQFSNRLATRADRRAESAAGKGSTVAQDAARIFPNDPKAQRDFILSNSKAEIARKDREQKATDARLKLKAESIPDFKDVTTLRKEFTSVSTDFQEIGRNLNTINTLAARKDAAGDLALVVAFTKLLDPGSVAREGEVKLTQSAQGVIDKAGNTLERLRKGETLLTDTVRQQFVDAANELGANYSNSFKTRQSEFTTISQTFFPDLDPSLILVGANDPTVEQPTSGTQTVNSSVGQINFRVIPSPRGGPQ